MNCQWSLKLYVACGADVPSWALEYPDNLCHEEGTHDGSAIPHPLLATAWFCLDHFVIMRDCRIKHSGDPNLYTPYL
jgi:hypothetical protein